MFHKRAPLFLGALAALILAGCGESANSDGIIRVPSEVDTLQEAEDLAEPGDTIFVENGHFAEQLLITTPDITVRGEDRNETIIDGEGIRPYGIVAMADGVRVENLTVTDTTFYGLLFTGLHDNGDPSAPTASGYEPWDPEGFPPLQRFHADHITATNNGLYGIYAFNSQHGSILNSYASGSADSGIYVGQCRECNILIAGNVAERNAVGFENANASDDVVVTGNRFVNNRVGATLLSNYQEAFVPQHGNLIFGNVIADNNEHGTPSQADGGFGTGMGLSGAQGNRVFANHIVGHDRVGVMYNNAEDIPSSDNIFAANNFGDNSLDLVNASANRTPASNNCVESAQDLTILPSELSAMLMTDAACDDVNGENTVEAATSAPTEPEAPAGMSYRQVALPKAQPNLPQQESYERLPDHVELPTGVDAVKPELSLLAELSGSSK